VMCRAVLDAEFQANISPDDCIQALGDDDRKVSQNGLPLYTLGERISVAEKIGRIDYATKEKAYKVVRCGNQIVHRTPDTQHDAYEIIVDTLAVIDALCS